MLNPSSQPLKWTVQLSVCLLIYLTCSRAFAQVYNSSVSAGAGETGIAAVEAGDSIYLNPATLPHLRGRHLLGSYAEHDLAVSLSDNTRESTLPGAIGYVQRKTTTLMNGTKRDVRSHDFSVTLADFVKGSFSVGLTGHFFDSKVENNSSSFRQTNADLGFAYILNPHMGFGAVFYNLMGAKSSIPEDFRLQPRAGLGFNYIYQSMLRYRLDVLSGPQYHMGEMSFMTGFESFLSEFVVWRAGYKNDNYLHRNLFTLGLGFNGPKFALNYAYESNTKESSDYRHSVDLQIPF